MHLVFVVVLGEGAMEMRIGLACYLPILVSIRLQKSAKFAGDSVQSRWELKASAVVRTCLEWKVGG